MSVVELPPITLPTVLISMSIWSPDAPTAKSVIVSAPSVVILTVSAPVPSVKVSLPPLPSKVSMPFAKLLKFPR